LSVLAVPSRHFEYANCACRVVRRFPDVDDEVDPAIFAAVSDMLLGV